MKRLGALASIVALMGTLSWADTTTPPPAPPAGGNGGPGHPCMEIEQACTSAGFVKGEAAQGKGLFKDCMQPIMHGQTVSGVTVNPTVVTACKQRMANRHMHRQGGQGGQGGPNGGNGGGSNSESGAKPNEDSDSSGQ